MIIERVTLRRLREFTSVDPAGLRAVVGRVTDRKPALRVLPTVVALAAFFGWMLLFGIVTDFADSRLREDVLSRMVRQGWQGTLLAVFLGYGLGALLSFGCYYVLRIKLLTGLLRRRLRNDECLLCGYSLRGHRARDSEIRCPECGFVPPISSPSP